jgi:hypothetical protein
MPYVRFVIDIVCKDKAGFKHAGLDCTLKGSLDVVAAQGACRIAIYVIAPIIAVKMSEACRSGSRRCLGWHNAGFEGLMPYLWFERYCSFVGAFKVDFGSWECSGQI